MHKKKNNKKEIPATTTAFIGAALLLVGGFFLFYNYIESKKIIRNGQIFILRGDKIYTIDGRVAQ